MTDIHFKRYLKYKLKYLELKQSGSGLFSSPNTVKMHTNVYKYYTEGIQKSDDYTQYTEYKEITQKLLSNFINDNKSSIRPEITTALNLNFFTKISLDNTSLEKVNFTRNLTIIDDLMKNKANYNITFINKLDIFTKEIKEYDAYNGPLKIIKDIKYVFDFRNILDIYILFLTAIIKKHIFNSQPKEEWWDKGRPNNSTTRPGAVRR
jgi:hypothetical protein